MVPAFHRYEKIIVAFSGGKDSLACVLRLLDLGVLPEQMELWHHDVDGREDPDYHLMDWPDHMYEEATDALFEMLDEYLRTGTLP